MLVGKACVPRYSNVRSSAERSSLPLMGPTVASSAMSGRSRTRELGRLLGRVSACSFSAMWETTG